MRPAGCPRRQQGAPAGNGLPSGEPPEGNGLPGGVPPLAAAYRRITEVAKTGYSYKIY